VKLEAWVACEEPINFILANPRLEDLQMDIELNKAIIVDQSNMLPPSANIKSLSLHSGIATQLFMLTYFQLNDLTAIQLRERTLPRRFKEEFVYDVPIPADLITSLKRAIISNSLLWGVSRRLFHYSGVGLS
jgi:hypothetical protein